MIIIIFTIIYLFLFLSLFLSLLLFIIIFFSYEIQLLKEVQRKGLGKFLMQILELMAHK